MSTQTSIFLNYVKISDDELAEFTGWNINQHYSWFDITKFIYTYIKNNQLTIDNQNIQCDDKLKNLFKYDLDNIIGEDGQLRPLNYFNLQLYLRRHIIISESEQSQ